MNDSWRRKLTAGVAVAAACGMLIGLGGCGGSSSSDAVGAAEPADGFANDYTGTYPMPDANTAYNNPQERDNVQDGGTLTLATTYTSSWNSFSADGNTSDMQTLWSYYMPQLYTTDFSGNITWNKDYITDVTTVSDDPLVVKFTINDKAKWNDGTDIDWTAFRATWEVSNGSNDGYNPASTEGWNQIKSVTEGDNAKQAVITFSQPWYPWQSLFGGLYNPEAEDTTTFTSGWNDNPHSEWGAGPWKVQTANDDEVVFVPNENWWGDKPKLTQVTYKYMEPTAELNAFKNGEIDAVEFATNTSLQTVKDTKDTQIRLGYSKSTNVLVYNGKSTFLSDQNVRKAFEQAFDGTTWTKIHYQGLNWTPSAPGSELFPVFQEGYEDNRPDVAKQVDVDGAKKTLEADGYTLGSDGYYQKDGKTLEVRYTYFGDAATGTALAKAYQQMLKEAGIKVDLDNQDTSKFSDVIGSGDYDVLPMGWSAPTPYSQVNVAQLYGSDSDSNYTYVGSDEVDKLAAVPGTISDQLKAVAAANKAEKAALALYGTEPVDVPPAFFAVKKGLANYGPAGFTSLDVINLGWQKS
ncbi:ABC transporter family substrate-binding protein [Bifidobacterium choloepi]|uniref:ABC transporter family substrate-binding protein n=1 Tax=Bifidobacterium choloepi TaxID=2614131 RepID=A0A6I5N202_9BIFI|nr:ABC transporter family substrate-binding protein [Bifidobacterium choloepi]NEG70506.1 ABC transporter family substrate-binding protein [Bifidobacterium choloepi]